MRYQVGNVIQESNGDEITVYIDQYGAEAPDSVTVEGQACNIVFDPGTMDGQAQIEALRARLAEALANHERAVEEIYGKLRVGDYCTEIRLPVKDERRCAHTVTDGRMHWTCSRAQHVDFHHVNVDGDYRVIAVCHATDHVLPRVSR